jgi:hypothetical protein
MSDSNVSNEVNEAVPSSGENSESPPKIESSAESETTSLNNPEPGNDSVNTQENNMQPKLKKKEKNGVKKTHGKKHWMKKLKAVPRKRIFKKHKCNSSSSEDNYESNDEGEKSPETEDDSQTKERRENSEENDDAEKTSNSDEIENISENMEDKNKEGNLVSSPQIEEFSKSRESDEPDEKDVDNSDPKNPDMTNVAEDEAVPTQQPSSNFEGRMRSIPKEFQFEVFNRIISLPFVKNILNSVANAYTNVKERSPVPFWSWWNFAENGIEVFIQLLAALSGPLLWPFHSLDNFICRTIDVMVKRNDPFESGF